MVTEFIKGTAFLVLQDSVLAIWVEKGVDMKKGMQTRFRDWYPDLMDMDCPIAVIYSCVRLQKSRLRVEKSRNTYKFKFKFSLN